MRKFALTVGFILIVFASQAIWVTFSPIVTYTAEELRVSVELIGFLAVTYPIFFLILTMPSGILLDKNFKLWLGLGVLFTFIAGVGRLVNLFSYWWLFACQLFGALGQPFLLNAFVPFASRVWEERRALLVSLLSLSMYLGTVFALFSGFKLYNIGGILFVVIPWAIISVLGLLFFLVGIPATEERVTERKILNLRGVIGRRDLWIIGIILGLGVAAFDNLATWLQPALKSVGLENVAGDAVALAIIAGLIGVVFIPDRISMKNLRTIYLRTVIPIVTILFTILALAVNELLLFSFLAISGFLMLPSYPIIMDWIGKFHERDVHGSATGFVGLISRAISVALMLVATSFIFNARIYLAFLTAIFVVALVFAMMLPKDQEIEVRS
ncbi:MFS transporter [Archaeoglobales archaeon]|nr:MAG: MFS transporter [Archaeoglobales archaeon]